MSLLPREREQVPFKGKGKLDPLKNAKVQAPAAGSTQVALLYRDHLCRESHQWGEEMEFSGHRTLWVVVLSTASLHVAHCRHLEWQCLAKCLCTRPQTTVLALVVHTWNSGFKCLVQVSACCILWASETNPSTKEMERKKRLDYITQILFLFPWELWMGFAGEEMNTNKSWEIWILSVDCLNVSFLVAV